MSELLREALGTQFQAALQMLGNALRACPEEDWGELSDTPGFWYTTFHTLFWLDFYLSPSVEGFAPPAPFGLEELDPAGKLPPRVYTQQELLDYLEHGRGKCREACARLDLANAAQPSGMRPGLSRLELHIYNLRHVQHGAAQLNLRLRQRGRTVPDWVSRSR